LQKVCSGLEQAGRVLGRNDVGKARVNPMELVLTMADFEADLSTSVPFFMDYPKGT
jgi:hypothetical protein